MCKSCQKIICQSQNVGTGKFSSSSADGINILTSGTPALALNESNTMENTDVHKLNSNTLQESAYFAEKNKNCPA